MFLITDDNELVEMKSAGYATEDEIQALIARFPKLLSGCAADPDTAEWLLVSRELAVPDSEGGGGRWSLDHLFIDNEGVPVLVEVKRGQDTRIRREVVGQMLDYAANAVAYWPIEHLQESFYRQAEIDGTLGAVRLEQFLAGRKTEAEFWRTVKTNLQAGRLRMVFVADRLPSELRRIIEFMNEQMDPAEVLGVEVRQFSSGRFRSISPSVVGRTSVAESRKDVGLGKPAVPKPGLMESVDEFTRLMGGLYKIRGTSASYRVVSIPGFPGPVHYEFLHTAAEGVTAELHVESLKFGHLSERLREFAASARPEDGMRIVHDPKWSRVGRIRVLMSDKSPVSVARSMKWLIDSTLPRITEQLVR